MADQGMWFKLWIGADDDPDLGNLPLDDFGRWCRFGLYLKKHGTNGTIQIRWPALPVQQIFHVSSFDDVVSVLQRFPNCDVTGKDQNNVSSETILTVSWRNWGKYQGDLSTSRVRKYRQKKRSKRRGEEKRREEIRINSSPTPSLWPDPGKLIEKYNAETPKECPAVETISKNRIEKAKKYISLFPKEEFWTEVFAEIHKSSFLRGFSSDNGHRQFVADFDWLLTKGRDGTENCVKVHDGKYLK